MKIRLPEGHQWKQKNLGATTNDFICNKCQAHFQHDLIEDSTEMLEDGTGLCDEELDEKDQKHEQAFTLIELMVVIVIFGIVVAVVGTILGFGGYAIYKHFHH